MRLGAEIEALAERLTIPGLAYGVVQHGELLFDGAVGYSGTPDQPFSVRTPLDIASISKSIAAVAIMQAVGRGELALSDPVKRYLPDFSGPPEITVRHLLSHTSEGIPGDEYKYMPTRYALLGSILEQTVGQSYPSIVRERILEPAAMEEYPSPNLTAGWGMISTAENLFKFAIALDRQQLIHGDTQELMATPTESPRGVNLPVSLGWFCQRVQNEPVAWGFGQGEETSVLFLRIPRLHLTLVIAAESDRLSNPFRLLHGDVRSSPFAMAFFRNFVASPAGARLSPDWTTPEIADLEAELDAREAPGSYWFGNELVAQSLLEVEGDTTRAGDLMELALRRYPDMVPTLSWLELATWIGRESLGPFAVQLADRLVRTRPTSPWVLVAAGDAYMKYGDPLEAVAAWSRLGSLPNQEEHILNIGLNAEALNNIGTYWLDIDPGLARTFFLRVIETGGAWELRRSQHLLKQALGSMAASKPLEDAITALVPELLDEYNVPGASVAVIREGEIETILDFGVRWAGSAARVDDHTVFEAASLSKPVFAYGVHLLVQQGILDLDRPLSEYLESPYVDDPRLDRITARLVLSHSSGFPNWRPRSLSDDPGPLLIEFDPGERFQYSGEAYLYLQRAVEHLTGKSLDCYLERAVLEPLGMSDSSFLWEEKFEGVYAAPHDGDGAPGHKWRPTEALAVGTLNTTTRDYARFLQALVANGNGPLASSSIERMLTPHSIIDQSLGWSLGWGIERRDNEMLFWQWGENDGIKTLAAGSGSTGTAVVVFTNGQWGHNVSRPIIELVLGEGRFLDFYMVNYRP